MLLKSECYSNCKA